MTYLHYASSRTRERSPLFDDDEAYYSARRLVRTNSKRAYDDDDDDDYDYDDYPYSTNYSKSKAKPSRALTIRQAQPSQLEKYNVWSRPTSSSPKHSSSKHSHSHAHSDDEDEREREREFRLKIKASFGRPKSSHASEHKAMAWSSDIFRRKDKWVDEEWETRERERGRRNLIFDDEPVKEKSVRFHRVKRTRTDEWKPLSGWRRS
ncbi:hypothetical protein BU23DRAFT_462039 [Bimuria novae-zelandiae CBS 107.79]|uniref:Uncharacterized protein n=1 Tax=Bimuria novae-zelandiae CBS 107.79 TaxID=1447943 RepID=A0A6A5VB31_9PLEO|nr:hypothetical protein BU23DRAFT_462039 [Bimuria novae-zelandiae CBS 107.79]